MASSKRTKRPPVKPKAGKAAPIDWDRVGAGLKVFAEKVALPAVERVAAQVGEYVRLDQQRNRVFVSDATVKEMVDFTASRMKGVELREFRRRKGGYSCALRTGGGVVRATAELTKVVWRGRSVALTFATPEPIEIEGRPVITFLASAIARMFGGTWAAKSMLSQPLPENVTWDGRNAVFVFGMKHSSRPRVISGDAGLLALDVSQDDMGLWVKAADPSVQIQTVTNAIAEFVAEAMAGGP